MTRRIRLARRTLAAGMLAAPALLGTKGARAAETLTMWTFLNLSGNTPRDRALKLIVEKFEAQNPEIRVRVESQVWSTLPERFVMAHRAGNAPDIGWVNGENMGLLVNSGVAADLGPLITDRWSPSMRQDLVLPAANEWLKQGGKQHALPIMALSIVMFGRRDLFREAGLDPAGMKTWDDLATYAARMQKSEAGRVERWGVGLALSTDRTSMSFAANALMGSQGGKLFGERCAPLLANEHGVRAVLMEADLIRRHKVASPESFAFTLDDSIEQFIGGRVALTSSGNGRFGNIVDRASWGASELMILPWPSFDATRPGPQYMSGWFAAISRTSRRQEAAARFVDYMCGPEAMEYWTEPGGLVPLYRSVAEKPQFRDARYDWLRGLAAMWAQSEAWLPADCNVARTISDLNRVTQRVVLGNADPMAALREAEATTRARQ